MYAEVEGKKHILAHLVADRTEQVSFDLYFRIDQDVTFSVQGKGEVHLGGYKHSLLSPTNNNDVDISNLKLMNMMMKTKKMILELLEARVVLKMMKTTKMKMTKMMKMSSQPQRTKKALFSVKTAQSRPNLPKTNHNNNHKRANQNNQSNNNR